MDNSKVLVAREGTTALIQVHGRGSFQNAGAVKSFYLRLIEEGVDGWTVDLGDCSYLDSTFLGTLTGLGLKLKEKGHGKLRVVNVNSRNLELMQNLGLNRLFNVTLSALDLGGAVKPMEELEQPRQDKREAGLDMLEAHNNLMDVDARNVPKFKDVVAYLKEDLGVAGE